MVISTTLTFRLHAIELNDGFWDQRDDYHHIRNDRECKIVLSGCLVSKKVVLDFLRHKNWTTYNHYVCGTNPVVDCRSPSLTSLIMKRCLRVNKKRAHQITNRRYTQLLVILFHKSLGHRTCVPSLKGFVKQYNQVLCISSITRCFTKRLQLRPLKHQISVEVIIANNNFYFIYSMKLMGVGLNWILWS